MRILYYCKPPRPLFGGSIPLFRRLRVEIVQPTPTSGSTPSSGQAMLEYFGHLSARLQQMTISAQQFIYFSGLTAGAIVSAGMVNHKPLVVILAPYALTLVLTYPVQLYTDVECLTTIKEHIESELNRSLSIKMYLESAVLTSKYRNRWSIRVVQYTYIVLMIGIFIQSVRTSHKTQTRWRSGWLKHIHMNSLNWHYLNIFGIAVCIILLGLASLELIRANKVARKSISIALDTTQTSSGNS
jgi:hypothetical protein